MYVARCPKCAHRELITEGVVGHVIGCSRCDRTFTAVPLSGIGRVRDVIVVVAVLAIGGIVAWIMMRGWA
jgi:hypothetical protein